MSDWASGYRAALADVNRLLTSRRLMTKEVAALLTDMDGDAFVIEHEQDSRTQRKRLRAAREAVPLELPG